MTLLFIFVPILIILVGLVAVAALLFTGWRLLARKHYLAGGLALSVILILVGVLFWLFDNSIRIPSKERLQATINDGLRKDCANLSSTALDSYHLDKERWPKSIRELHPRSVYVAGDEVLIDIWHSCPEWERQFDIMDDKVGRNITLEVEKNSGPHDFSKLTAVYVKVYDGIYLSYPKNLEPRIRSDSNILDSATFSGGHTY